MSRMQFVHRSPYRSPQEARIVDDLLFRRQAYVQLWCAIRMLGDLGRSSLPGWFSGASADADCSGARPWSPPCSDGLVGSVVELRRGGVPELLGFDPPLVSPCWDSDDGEETFGV
jgi:hypothetical protein